MNSVESSLDDAGTEYTSEISKYPNKVLFLTTTDENNNVGILAIGTVKYGSTTAFIQCNVTLRTATNKPEAIAMIYKIFGME